jgi:protein subunit release factor A
MTDEELRVEFLALHEGGQMVGTPPCLIRVTHLPTGMAVTITDKRGQHTGRAYALEMLKMMVGDFA